MFTFDKEKGNLAFSVAYFFYSEYPGMIPTLRVLILARTYFRKSREFWSISQN